jgi:signal recognition particle GTPase
MDFSIVDILLIAAAIILLVGTLANFLSKVVTDESEHKSPSKIEPKNNETPEVGPTWSDRLQKGLSRTRKEVWGKVQDLISGPALTENEIEEIEEILYTSDISPMLIAELLDVLKDHARSSEDKDMTGKIKEFFKQKCRPLKLRVIRNFILLIKRLMGS